MKFLLFCLLAVTAIKADSNAECVAKAVESGFGKWQSDFESSLKQLLGIDINGVNDLKKKLAAQITEEVTKIAENAEEDPTKLYNQVHRSLMETVESAGGSLQEYLKKNEKAFWAKSLKQKIEQAMPELKKVTDNVDGDIRECLHV